MAMAASARAVLAMKAQQKKIQALKLARQEGDILDEEQKGQLIQFLTQDSSTRFIANLAQGKPLDEDAEGESEGAKLGKWDGTVAWDEYEGEMPVVRPHFLSDAHYGFMVEQLKGKSFQDSSFDRYLKFHPKPHDPRARKLSIHVLETITKENSGNSSQFTLAHKRRSSRRVSIKENMYQLDGIPDDPEWVHRYNEFVLINQKMVASFYFNALVVACIVLAGILVGVQSYPSMNHNPSLAAVDLTIQVIFTLECVVKIFAEGTSPWVYWTGPERYWHNFDFWIVFVAWLPFNGSNVAFLRLLRLMRLLKLVGKVKQLQVIIHGLAMGLSSVSYIIILMLLIFYVFAVVGVNTFRTNDPFHFGSLGVAMLSLFRCATLEDWSDIMYINYYGCDSLHAGAPDVYGGSNMAAPPSEALGTGEKGMGTKFGYFPVRECWKPSRKPFISTVFFLVFILIAAFVLLSLFVGAVCGGMSDALDAFKEQIVSARAARNAKLLSETALNAALGANGTNQRIEALREAFDACDEDKSGAIDAEELCEMMSSMGDTKVTVEIAKEMIATLDDNGDGHMGFNEFVKLMTGGALSAKDQITGRNGVEKSNRNRRQSLSVLKLVDPETAAKERAFRMAEARERAVALGLVSKIRHAWRAEGEEMDFDAVRSPYWRAYLKLSVKADAFVNNAYFANLVTLTIIAAGIVVGVQTETDVPSDGSGNKSRGENDNWVLDGLESAILVVFAVEMFGKILAEGFQPLHYFHDSWNCFDSVIVSAGFVSVGLDTESGNTLIYLRLFRILRVLKLVKALPELRVFTSSLISGLGSIFFVTVIVFTFFYLFANIGIIFFAENDPMHFGNLQTALLSVFRAATLDDWTDIMYTNMLGCDVWGYSFGDKNLGFDERDLVNDHVNCTHPQALGWVAGAYMVLFIVIGALVLLTLFIGIVATALEEAKDDHKNEIINEKKVFERCVTLGIDQRCTLPVYREIFDDLDVRNEGVLDHEDMKPLLRTLPLMHIARLASAVFAEVEEGTDGSVVTAELEKLQDNWAADSSNDEKANGVCLSGKDIERLVQVVDQNKSGSLEFSEFLLVMDIMKRADEDPSFVGHFRETYLLVKSEKVKRKRTFTARSKSSGSNLFSSPFNSPLCSSTDVINEHSTDGGDGDNDDDDDHAQTEAEDRHLSGGGLNFSVSDSSPQAIASLEQECAALRKLFYQQALELSPEQSEITEGDPSANHLRAVALRLQNEVLFLKSMTDEISAKVAANESTFTKDIPKSPHGEETKNRFDFSSDHMTPPSNATRPKMKRQTSGPFAVFRRVSAEPPPQRSPRSIDRSFEGLPPLEASVGSFFGSKEPLHTRVHPDPEGALPERPPDLVDL